MDPSINSTYGLDARGQNKVDICHFAGNNNYSVISVSTNALPAHLAHGDVVLEDEDGDGYFAFNECGFGGPIFDCDDSDPSVSPGAEEICGDGIDNDCDGVIDEDCCPCFTYAEALARAQAKATGYFAEDCYNLAEGFYDSPINWGIGGPPLHSDWFCLPFTGQCIYEERSVIMNCLAIVRQVQEQVQKPSCPESFTGGSPFILSQTAEKRNEIIN